MLLSRPQRPWAAPVGADPAPGLLLGRGDRAMYNAGNEHEGNSAPGGVPPIKSDTRRRRARRR